MIERVVENWLTNTNEKGYQIPFCQFLISKKYTILPVSSHGQMEQGKDIIAIDENGIPCAFQLKSGDINGNHWRKIKGEIDELVEIPINFPKINKKTKHRSIFVTNGRITDKVRRDTDDRNFRYKQLGLPELEIITGSELLKKFIDIHGLFLPTELSDFRIFLELLLSDGHELLDKKPFTHFLESVLFTEKATKPKIKRKIASSILLTQYVLQPHESIENHIPIIEGWTILCSYILSLVEKYGLAESYWRQSYDLIIQKINAQIELLNDEFFSRDDLTEGHWDGGFIYKSRITMILGWLSAFELYKKQTVSNYEIDQRVYDSIKQYYKGKTWFWGESATPLFVMMSLLAFECGDTSLSNMIICDLIIEITSENNFRGGRGIPDPYFSPNEIISHLYQLPKAEMDMSSFLGASYHLEALVDILVRRNKRTLLEEMWRNVSYIQKCEFNPQPSWKMFTWECKVGEQVERFYKNPQSWKELMDAATKKNGSDLPNTLLNNPFSYYFLICFPHRLNGYTVKIIDRDWEEGK